MRFTFTILIIIILSGCETFGTMITDEQLADINKVGFVSLIDDKISYNYVGVTIFNNKDTLYSFSGLNIDDYIITNISSALRRANPKVEVIPVNVDFDEYKAAYENQELISSLDVNSFSSLFSGRATELGLKYVIVASRDSIQFDEAPVEVNGFGLRKRSGQEKVGSFVLIKFQLIDITTQKEIAKARVFERERESDFEWLEPFDKNDDSYKDAVKKYIYQSIRDWSRSVAYILIQSPRDFQVCSEKIYAKGFEVDGETYTTREAVIEVRRKFISNKIKKENVHPKKSLPPYEGRFEAKEDEVLDCIAELARDA